MISAHVPLAECQRYATDLRAFTQARGDFVMEFAHYEEVPAHLVETLTEAHKQQREQEH
jgi:elongation factor G